MRAYEVAQISWFKEVLSSSQWLSEVGLRGSGVLEVTVS